MEGQINLIIKKIGKVNLTNEEIRYLVSYINAQDVKINNFKQTVDLLLESNKNLKEEKNILSGKIMHAKYQITKALEILDHE